MLTKRKSNFELLRILAMLLIICTHLYQHGIWFSPEDTLLTPKLIAGNIFAIWTGSLGNYLFILISGYFLLDSNLSIKKFFKLWLEIFSISVIIGVILYITKTPVITPSNTNYELLGFNAAAIPMTKKDLINCFTPTFSGNNWFATTYLVFYLFIPILNTTVKSLNQKKHLYLCLLLAILGTFVRMLPNQALFQETNIFFFILGYYIATYIKLYDPKLLKNQKLNILIVISLAILFILWIILILYLRNKVSFIKNNFIHFFCYPFALGRFPVLIQAIFCFAYFKNLNIPTSKILNKLASTTFGVYLIHENRFLNKVIWHKFFNFDYIFTKQFSIYIYIY